MSTQAKTLDKNELLRGEWKDAGYGRKKPINEHTTVIEVAQGKNTASGMAASELDENGFRPHDYPLETVKVIQGSIVYQYRAKDETEIFEREFHAEEEFNSVLPNGEGYWHVLKNPSETETAILEITAINGPTVTLSNGGTVVKINVKKNQVFNILYKNENGILENVIWPAAAPGATNIPEGAWTNSDKFPLMMFGHLPDALKDKAYVAGEGPASVPQHGGPIDTAPSYVSQSKLIMEGDYEAGQEIPAKDGKIFKYPRSFGFTADYEVMDDGAVKIKTTVKNKSDKATPSTWGEHLAYKVKSKDAAIRAFNKEGKLVWRGTVNDVAEAEGQVIELLECARVEYDIDPKTTIVTNFTYPLGQLWVSKDKEGNPVALAIETLKNRSPSRSHPDAKMIDLASIYESLAPVGVRGDEKSFEQTISVILRRDQAVP